MGSDDTKQRSAARSDGRTTLDAARLDDQQRMRAALDARGAQGLPSADVPTVVTTARELGVDLSTDLLWRFASDDSAMNCPPRVAGFITELAAGRTYDTVLDPFAGYGALLAEVCAAVKPRRALARYPRSECLEVAKRLVCDLELETHAGDLRGESLASLDEVDLIVSVPPFGVARRTFVLDAVPVDDHAGNELLVRAATRLRADGVALVVVPPAFMWTGGGVRAALPKLGLHLDAYFHLPPGLFAPATNIATGLIVLRRGPAPERLFVASYADDDGIRRAILERYRQREAHPSDPTLGGLVVDAEFTGMPALEARTRLARLAKRTSYPQQKLGELVDSIERGAGGDAPVSDDEVYLPLAPHRPAWSAREGLARGKARTARIVVDPTKALAPVLVEHFDGELGRAARAAAARGVTEATIPFGDLHDLPVWLPPLDEQRRLMELDRELRTAETQLQELRRELWTSFDVDRVASRFADVAREDSLADWIDTLPFPLASVLWSAEAMKQEPTKRFLRLDHFFETLTVFLAVVVLSACRANGAFWAAHGRELQRSLQHAGLSLERSTFGTWSLVVGLLAKRVRSELAADRDARDVWQRCFAIDDLDLLEALVSKPMVALLQRSNELRNDVRAHGGALGDDVARARLGALDEAVLELRRLVARRWARAPLVAATGHHLRQGRHINGVELAMGTRHPFERTEVELSRPLDEAYLHVISLREGSALTLLPLLRFGPSPPDERDACYFFNRVEHGGTARFVSYHFEKRPEISAPPESSSELVRVLGSLFDS